MRKKTESHHDSTGHRLFQRPARRVPRFLWRAAAAGDSIIQEVDGRLALTGLARPFLQRRELSGGSNSRQAIGAYDKFIVAICGRVFGDELKPGERWKRRLITR
jgi:hypothetical protein